MNSGDQPVHTAEFNPGIKIYLLLYVALIMTVILVTIPFVIFWFAGIGQYFSRRYYENLKCTLTSRHLVFSKGVLFKVEKTIPLENIQDLTFLENPLLKAFDLRILKIETAGSSNPQGSDMKLIGILNTMDFKERVLRQREILTSGKETAEPRPAANDGQMVEILKEIKDILNEIKNK